MIGRWARLSERLPLVFFLGGYTFACYLGVLLLLVSKDFWAWTYYFAGPRLPSLHKSSLWALLTLLHGGPVFLWLGYEAATAGCKRYWKWQGLVARNDDPMATKWIFLPYALSVSFAVWALIRGGAFGRITAWGDYYSYVNARWSLFSRLTFFEWVNLYTWLPFLSACLFITRRASRWFLGLVFGVLVLLQLSIFQKKPLLTSIFVIACAAWAYWYGGISPRRVVHPRLWLKFLASLCLSLYLVNAVLTVRVVIANKPGVLALRAAVDKSAQDNPAPSQPAMAAEAASHKDSAAESLARAKARFESEPVLVDFSRTAPPPVSGRAIALYTFFAPLTRTSVPTIAYAELFPYYLPFYHLDLGLDIFGFGRMPDDNLNVFDQLWPEQRGGSGAVAVPFHFVLYSQGGILLALAGSLLAGAFLGVCWHAVSGWQRFPVIGSLLVSAILTYAVLISVDSLRNTTIETYGMIWAVVLLTILNWWASRIQRQKKSAPH